MKRRAYQFQSQQWHDVLIKLLHVVTFWSVFIAYSFDRNQTQGNVNSNDIVTMETNHE